MKYKNIAIVGIGDDGCASLSSRAFSAIAQARVLVGGRRHLAFFSDFSGQTIEISQSLDAVIAAIHEARLEANVCVLASGDPCFYGIATRLYAAFGRDVIECFPQPSSVSLAISRIGLPAQEVVTHSCHGRPMWGIATRLAFVRHLAILTDAHSQPQMIAAHLMRYGLQGLRAWVCEHLGGADERVRSFSLEELAALAEFLPLNVVVLERLDPAWRPSSSIAYVIEDELEKRMPKQGLVTKREVRVASLGALRLARDSVVWDIGTGSGSVALEAAHLAYEGSVWAADVDPLAIEIAQHNAQTLAIDNVHWVHGRAPECLEKWPNPDAVFIGGSKGSMHEILDIAWQRARDGAWIVANAITLDNQHQAYEWARARNLVPEIILHTCARARTLASYMRYEALNPVQILAVQKKETSA